MLFTYDREIPMTTPTERNYFAEMIGSIVTDAAKRRGVEKAVVVEEMKEFVKTMEETRKKYLEEHSIP
jgi:hypothetical protein